MPLHKVIYLPDPRLRAPTREVTVFDHNLRVLVTDMYETMYRENGVGLAAPQIGISLKIAVVDVSPNKSEKYCIINPRIVKSSGEVLLDEGCLSVPGVFEKAPRALGVTVRACNEDGEEYEITADGLLAHCLQHEIDHLNGKLFVDYLSPLKKQMARKRLAKHIRHQK